MVTNGNQTQCGDHFVMYRNIKSLCCAPGADVVLQVNYTSKTKETNSERKRSDLWLPEARGEEKGNWLKGVRRYKLPVI